MPARQTRVIVAFALWVTMTPLTAFALGTGPQVAAPESQATTAIETALIEHRCNVTDTPSASTDAQRQCLEAQLLSLRNDFGRDLSRLSASDRRSMDAACSRLQPAEHRDAYLGCLSEQLAAWHDRRTRGTLAASDAATAPALPLAPADAPAPSPPPASSRRLAMVIGGVTGLGLAAVGAVLFATKPRRTRRTCHGCGVDVLDADLCATCRHAAAEALRRAAADRAHNEVAPQEPDVPDASPALAAAPALPAAPAPSVVPALSGLPNVLTPPAVSAEDRKTIDEEHQHERAFDPYAVLGVSREAASDDVRAAYEEGKSKYEPDLVSHLGDEAQAHYKAKAESVERAYQMLAGSGVAPRA